MFSFGERLGMLFPIDGWMVRSIHLDVDSNSRLYSLSVAGCLPHLTHRSGEFVYLF
jgi:hypothetical protein